MILLFYLVNSIKVVIEVVLRHFHGVVIGAARCYSFVGKIFSLLVVSSGRKQWTRRFMWFEPLEPFIAQGRTVTLRLMA
jgi:hypothetical protein